MKGGIKISVGRRPHRHPFSGGKLHMLQENLGGWGKDILFKFMFHERIFQHMPEKMVQELLSAPYKGKFSHIG